MVVYACSIFVIEIQIQIVIEIVIEETEMKSDDFENHLTQDVLAELFSSYFNKKVENGVGE